MFGIDAGYFKEALVNLNHSERPECHARRNLNVVDVVNLEVAGLFDPVFDEWIAQGVLGLSLVEIGAFDDEAILADFILSHCLGSGIVTAAGRASAVTNE